MVYTYYVAYNAITKDGAQGFGNTEVNRNSKLTTFSQVHDIAIQVKQKADLRDCIVMNFILLSEKPE